MTVTPKKYARFCHVLKIFTDFAYVLFDIRDGKNNLFLPFR
jgi:hypothetical protein